MRALVAAGRQIPHLARYAAVVGAVCAAGGAWLLYKKSKRLDVRKPSKTSVCDAVRQPSEPAENPRLKRCVDMALSLHGLEYCTAEGEEAPVPCSADAAAAGPLATPLAASSGLGTGLAADAETGVLVGLFALMQTAWSEDVPAEISQPRRTPSGKVVAAKSAARKLHYRLPARARRLAGRKSKALAVAVLAFLALALLLVLVAGFLSIDMELRVAATYTAIACLLLVAPALQQGLPGGSVSVRAAVVRGTIEVPAADVPAVWKGVTSWAAASASPAAACGLVGAGATPGDAAPLRGLATRGPLSIAFEGSLTVAGDVAAPLTAFVMETKGGHRGSLSIHAYVVPAAPMKLAEAEATVTAKLRELVGSMRPSLSPALTPSPSPALLPAAAPFDLDSLEGLQLSSSAARLLMGELP